MNTIHAKREKQKDVFTVNLEGMRFFARWEEGKSWAELSAKDSQHIEHTDLEAWCREYLRLRAEEHNTPCV